MAEFYTHDQFVPMGRIATARDSQRMNLLTILPQFFEEETIRKDIRQEIERYPQFDIISISLVAVVHYVWTQTKERIIPTNWNKIDLGPNSKVVLDVFGTESKTPKILADVVRYMRLILNHGEA